MIMLKTWMTVLAALAMFTGCTNLSTLAPAGSMPRIEGTPGKAVVYLVRTRPDTSYLAAPVELDGRMIGTDYAGTYFRLELTPGRHRLSGYAQDSGAITLDVQADRIYFVQHSVAGSWRATNPNSFFTVISERRARAALTGTQSAGNV
jgi:hypothetical protein